VVIPVPCDGPGFESLSSLNLYLFVKLFILLSSFKDFHFFYNFNMKINACFLLVKNTTKYLIAGNLLNKSKNILQIHNMLGLFWSLHSGWSAANKTHSQGTSSNNEFLIVGFLDPCNHARIEKQSPLEEKKHTAPFLVFEWHSCHQNMRMEQNKNARSLLQILLEIMIYSNVTQKR
jgi:hypothetical protein